MDRQESHIDRMDLGLAAWRRIGLTKAGFNSMQLTRIKHLKDPRVMSGLELQWATSLADAILGGYHEADGNLLRLTGLVSVDGEGYLYFDGIRGDNITDGVLPFDIPKVVPLQWNDRLMPLARDFEARCMTAMLSGKTVQQRDQPTKEDPDGIPL